MANSPQAIKRARQAEKRTLHNASQKSEMRSAIKKVLKSLGKESKEAVQANLKRAAILLDRMAGRGIIAANKAARLKSRLNKKVKAS